MNVFAGRDAKVQAGERISGHDFENREFLWEALQIAGSSVTHLNGRELQGEINRWPQLGMQ